MAETVTAPGPLNGIDREALARIAETVMGEDGCTTASFRVTTDWKGRTRTESVVRSFNCTGQPIPRSFTIASDEPEVLLGDDSAPNPQELLLSAINACMMIGYVAQATLRGISLSDCRIETEGELDLRGFLGLDENVPPGYRRINYTVWIDGDGTREQFQEIHEAVMATSPNYFNLAQPIQMCGRLA